MGFAQHFWLARHFKNSAAGQLSTTGMAVVVMALTAAAGGASRAA
jgi:hypothetical protein